MSESKVTKDGMEGARPGSKATTGVNVPPGGGGPRHAQPRPDRQQFQSYYGKPILNQPVWQEPDIPGYLFLGGLAGASAVIAAAAGLSRRPALARVSKIGAAAAGQLSLVALVHDLGRPSRFLNMLRMFKVTSPMSVGSWLLAGFVPAASVAALTDITRKYRGIGALAAAGAAVLGPPVTSYTAALICNTAVPAWHNGHREMPLLFSSSGLAAASGLGLFGAPTAETGPLRPLAVGAALGEVGLSKLMERRMGLAGEAYHQGKAKTYLRAAEALTAGGALLVATGGRSRIRNALGGMALLGGSALTRFGIFQAGLVSAEDPKYTVVPQRERLRRNAST